MNRAAWPPPKLKRPRHRTRREFLLPLLLVIAMLPFLSILFFHPAPPRYPDGPFNPDTYHGPMSTIVTPSLGRSTLTLWDWENNNLYYSVSQDGVHRLPVGRYQVESWEVQARDDHGVTWIGRIPSFHRLRVAVAPGMDTTLDPWTGVRAKLSAYLDPSSGEVTCELTFSHERWRYPSLVRSMPSERHAVWTPVECEVLDSRGISVLQGRFRAG